MASPVAIVVAARANGSLATRFDVGASVVIACAGWLCAWIVRDGASVVIARTGA